MDFLALDASGVSSRILNMGFLIIYLNSELYLSILILRVCDIFGPHSLFIDFN